MLQLEDLAQMAEELRRAGVDAWHEVVAGPRGYLEGLDIGDDFFPLWELILPENRASLECCDFAAIKARRAPDWSVAPPLSRAG